MWPENPFSCSSFLCLLTDSLPWEFRVDKSQARDFPGGTSGKEFDCQCKRCKTHRFHSWVGKIPWRRKWQPALVFLPGRFHGLRSLGGYSPWGQSRTLSTHTRIPRHGFIFLTHINIKCILFLELIEHSLLFIAVSTGVETLNWGSKTGNVSITCQETWPCNLCWNTMLRNQKTSFQRSRIMS